MLGIIQPKANRHHSLPVRAAALACSDRAVRVVATDGEVLPTLPQGYIGRPSEVSPDGRFLMTSTSGGETGL